MKHTETHVFLLQGLKGVAGAENSVSNMLQMFLIQFKFAFVNILNMSHCLQMTWRENNDALCLEDERKIKRRSDV